MYYRMPTPGTNQHLQVGLEAGYSGGYHLGPLLPPKRAWIESTMASRIPYLFSFTWDAGTQDGWAFRKYAEKNTVVGSFKHDGNWCLTASGTHETAGIVLAPCDGRWTQAWWIGATGTIRSLADTSMCMDVAGGANGNGIALQMYPCSTWHNQAQRFRFQSNGEIRTGINFNRCVDLPWNSAYDGAPLQTYDCNGTSAQRWTF